MRTILVVPCYNESGRWNPSYWDSLIRVVHLDVLFVNDGSTDDTARRITETCVATGATALTLPTNVGKGEALRQGMLAAWDGDSDMIGYLDADGAFPADEVRRMAADATDLLGDQGRQRDAVWSARILMAGRDIERHRSRHYLGRIITTIAAPWHGYAIYDTQSGYKIFRRDAALRECLNEPFQTRWFPDIELLQRWVAVTGRRMDIWEDPVTGWHDVAGSKMNRSQYVQILKDLAYLRRSRPKDPQGTSLA
jgi:glycosyltransferase involved in cell wall biosynthesis